VKPPADKPDPNGADPSGARRRMAIQMTALGLEFGGAVIGGLIVGYYLDDWLGTEPWLMLLGTFGGLATAVIRILALTKRFQRMRDAPRE
jgi:F0F1-type ATP synthase assembly protein I